MASITALSAPLPAGGVAGQVLEKNTTASGDVSWASLAGAGPTPNYLSGYWFNAMFRLCSTAFGTQALTASTTVYVPFYLSVPLTITSLALQVATAATATLSAGVSASTGAGLPGVLLASVTGLSGSVAGMIAGTLPTALTIPVGWNHLSLGTTAAITMSGYPPISQPPNPSGGPAVVPQSGHYPTRVAAASAPASNPTFNTTMLPTVPNVFFRVA